METKYNSVELLIETAEEYGKTSVELYRLKTIDKFADIISSLVSKLTVIIAFILFFLILNIGTSLWIGNVLGKTYLGFFIVAAFYALIAIILYLFKNKWIKSPLRNSIITQTLN